MKNSGELSDAAFAFLVERWCLNPDTLSAFAIDLYGRFKDDIIIVARNRNLTKHFVWGMKHRSKYYKINVQVSVKFLEVRVWKDGSRFVTGPEFKPTSQWQTVGNRQCSWPAARLIMSRALSGNLSIFQKAEQELINRFISHFAPESVVMNLKRTDGLAAVKRVTGSIAYGMLQPSTSCKRLPCIRGVARQFIGDAGTGAPSIRQAPGATAQLVRAMVTATCHSGRA